MLNQRAFKAVDTHTFTKLAEKANGNSFLGQEKNAVGGIHATRDHRNFRNVLRNTKKLCRAGHLEQKG
jgi:hypothetical protein